jgi:glycosyltransferase involved in cell wall biosynthesis
MMRGTAVVASGGSGLDEQVVEGVTGALVAAGDAPALAAALERVLLDRDLAERLGAAGRERALAELSEDRHVERMLELYGELVVPARRGDPASSRRAP